jgi:hypothetical protein
MAKEVQMEGDAPMTVGEGRGAGGAVRRGRANGENNKIQSEDRPAHDWYRFVLSFPPHLVRDYIARFGASVARNRLGGGRMGCCPCARA